MSSCIICGKSVDGRICEIHQEDVVFEFRGSHPGELTPGRYYRGTVDGFAEFGVFVDVGDSVTGLLHRSELDRRLDSLDWDPGDTVFVQVQNVRDNGNVDLGWSIRQDETEFRGTLIDDPDADGELLAEEEDADEEGEDTPAGSEPAGDDSKAADGTGAETARSEPSVDGTGAESSMADSDSRGGDAATGGDAMRDLSLVTIDGLDEHVGQRVRIEGGVASARQTSGPTVFEVRDETGTVDCAAFVEAGVRAYPEVEEDDLVRIEGGVERRRGQLQVETEALVVLENEEHEAVAERMEQAMVDRARPDEVDPLAEDAAVDAVAGPLRDAATAIRRAVLEGRPVVVRHSASADGYLAGVAIERATLPLVRQQHRSSDAEYHFFDRRPLEGSVYGMDDATGDVTSMLENSERHGEEIPLFVFVAAGATAESLDGLELLDIYDARRVVIEDRVVDGEVADTVDTVVSPTLTDGGDTSATALAANVAAAVNGNVRGDLHHLPAVSFWEGIPDGYATLAAEAGYDEDAVRAIREAVALEAYYQSYEDKRELITDVVFADRGEVRGLAENVSEQFGTKMDAEIGTAEANLERREVGGETVVLLDTDAYTHRYEFPPEELLLDELYRRHREDATALVGLATDEAYVRTDADVDVRALVERAAETAPEAGLDARGAREGRVEFLSGERAVARDALLDALAGALSATPEA
jgi:RecJ-like exonuclease